MRSPRRPLLVAALLAAAVLAPATDALAGTFDVPRLLERQVDRINARSTIPVLLPDTLAAEPERLYPSGGAWKGGWDLQLGAVRGCGGATACFVASFMAQRGERPHFRRTVQLTGGRTGYFKPLTCGGSCSPPIIEWRRGKVLYSIQANAGAAETELQEMVALANSAIRGGPR